MMNRYWNAKIETKVAKNKNLTEKEKRLFQIKITGINDQNSPFKIKTQRNDELFTKEFNDYFKSILNLDEQLDQYLKCAYHGRNKRISLYVIGCETYTGLLILDENLYSLIPINGPTKSVTYRIELITPTIKYYTASDEDFKSLNPSQIAYNPTNQTNLSVMSHIDLILTLDKRFVNGLNADALNAYYQHVLLKCHLTWSYYYYEHQVKLQFKHLYADYFTDSDYMPRRHNNNLKLKLFNIDPLVSNKLQFKSLFDSLALKHKSDYLNQISVYSISDVYLNDTFIRLDGLATQSTFKFNCDLNKQASLILLKDKFNSNETNKFKQFAYTLEEANTLIDLIGINLGNRHRLNNLTNCQSDEYNWYFQVHSIQSSETIEQVSTELDDQPDTNSDLCLNRLIKINSSVIECNQISKSEISVVKEPTCGNGILEANEQCDCGSSNDEANYFKCLNCCNMSTCKFLSKDYECSNGECCDTLQCKFKPKTSVCRPAIGSTSNQTHTSCDWAEYCDGASSKCPENRFHHNGVECNEKNESGVCWDGKCISNNLQCKTYWSNSATNSDKSCYTSFNSIGFENGNCGVSLNENKRVYKACELVDAQCGLLQCQQGSNEPLVKSESYFKSMTSHKGQNYECKSITSQPSIYVLDGTKCDSSTPSVCVNQKCTSLNEIVLNQSNKCINPFKKQPILCSNNGVCDNYETCHCFENWSGKYCDQFTQNTYPAKPIQFNSNSSKLTTSSLVSIACGSAIFLFILLFILYLFIRRCRKSKPKKPIIKKSLSRSLIEFDNDYKVGNDYIDSKKESIFSSFKKSKSDAIQTSTRANSIVSLNNNSSNELTNSYMNQSGPNDCSISLTKVNLAIQQLNNQPAKSILKKANETAAQEDQNESNLTDEVNSSIKFERQVNRNTMINAAIGNGHRSSRRSLVYDHKRASVCSSSSTSSSSSSISLSSSSSESISSSLSKSNKSLDKPIQNNSSSESISSIVLQEPKVISSTSNQDSSNKSDFLKVQDYLNELHILSKQNQFTESNRNSKEVNSNDSDSQSPIKPISLLLNSYQTKLGQNRLENENSKLIETPQRPNSLLTTIFVNNSKVNEPRCVSSLTSPTQMLHLHISKNQIIGYDESNLLTNSSETSSGYMSNSTSNLNQPFKQLKQLQPSNNKQVELKKNSSRESLFETDDYYSIERSSKLNTNEHNESSTSNTQSNSSRSSSSALTPPPLAKLTSPTNTIKQIERPIDKRFSYILATASSNNLNIS